MRQLAVIMLIALVLGGLDAVSSKMALASAVYHFTGRVSLFDGKTIRVEGKEFSVKSRAVFLKHSLRNGAFFEEKIRSSDVRTGDSVVLHIDGTIVDKIIVEEWKR